jgi:hypothetical protein
MQLRMTSRNAAGGRPASGKRQACVSASAGKFAPSYVRFALLSSRQAFRKACVHPRVRNQQQPSRLHLFLLLLN